MKGFEVTKFQSCQVAGMYTVTLTVTWGDGRSSSEAGKSEISMLDAVKVALGRTISPLPRFRGEKVGWDKFTISRPQDFEITKDDGRASCQVVISIGDNSVARGSFIDSGSLEEAYCEAIVDAINCLYGFSEGEPASPGPVVGSHINA